MALTIKPKLELHKGGKADEADDEPRSAEGDRECEGGPVTSQTLAEHLEANCVAFKDYRGLAVILGKEGLRLRRNVRKDCIEKCETTTVVEKGEDGKPVARTVEGAWEVLDKKTHRFYAELRQKCAAHWRYMKEFDPDGVMPLPPEKQPKFRMSKQDSEDMVETIAGFSEVDEPMEWYKGIETDGLDWSMKKCLDILVRAVTDNYDDVDASCEYVRWFAAHCWTGTLARLLRPGCEIKTYPFFASDTNAGKTHWIKSMLPPHLSQYVNEGLSMSEDVRERRIINRGFVLMVLDEAAGSTRTEAQKLKLFFSAGSETHRDMNANTATREERTYFMVGSMNQEDLGVPWQKAVQSRMAILPVKQKKNMIDFESWAKEFDPDSEDTTRTTDMDEAEYEALMHERNPQIAWMDANRDECWKAAKLLYLRYGVRGQVPNSKFIRKKMAEYSGEQVYIPDAPERNALAMVERYDGYADIIDIAVVSRYNGIRSYGEENGAAPPVQKHDFANDANKKAFIRALGELGWKRKYTKFRKQNVHTDVLVYGHADCPDNERQHVLMDREDLSRTTLKRRKTAASRKTGRKTGKVKVKSRRNSTVERVGDDLDDWVGK